MRFVQMVERECWIQMMLCMVVHIPIHKAKQRICTDSACVNSAICFLQTVCMLCNLDEP